MGETTHRGAPEATLRAARDELQRRGIRATDQRVVVLAALMDRSGDASAQRLHEQLHEHHPTLGLATVYRTLATLAEEGVLDSMQHGHGICYRWCAPGHHHHLVCDGCHTVVEVRDCDVGGWAEQIAAAHGFSDVRHVVELSGTCPECRAGA